MTDTQYQPTNITWENKVWNIMLGIDSGDTRDYDDMILLIRSLIKATRKATLEEVRGMVTQQALKHKADLDNRFFVDDSANHLIDTAIESRAEECDDIDASITQLMEQEGV